METNQFDYSKYILLLKNNKRFFAVVSLVIMTIAVVVSYRLPKIYEAKSTVLFEKNIITDMMRGIAVTPSTEEKTRVLTYAVTSKELLVKVIEQLDVNKKGNRDKYYDLAKNIQASRISLKLNDKEGSFTVGLRDSSPVYARDFVNTLVRKYIEENSSSKKEESSGASRFLSEQLQAAREKLEKADAEVSRFKREKGALVDMDTATAQSAINDAQQRLDDMSIRRAQAESQLANLKKSNPQFVRLHALQKKLDELEGQYTDKYPEIIKTREEIEAIQSRLKRSSGSDANDPADADRVRAEINALKQAEATMRRTISRNQQMMNNIPSVRSELERLERDKAAQKAIYDQLAAKLGQSEVSQQVEMQDKSGNFKIIDPAVLPVKPISPKRVKIILMGIAGGLLGSFGLLFLKDSLDPSVKSVAMLKGLGYPVLASIPSIEDAAVTNAQKKSDFRLYILASTYFCMILIILMLEYTGSSLVDRLLGA